MIVSTARPQKSRMSRLKRRWRMPAWTRVAVSGVSANGIRTMSLTTRLPPRAAMKPPPNAAWASRPAREASSQAAAVTAEMASVTRAECQLSGGLTGDSRELPKAGSDELDLLDHIIAVARRRRHLDLVADRAADQRAAERRGITDPADLGVRLGLADDLVGHRLAVLVLELDGGAEDDLVAAQRLGIDDQSAAEAVLHLGDLRLDMALPFLGGMVFGVLRKVAMAARHLDRLDDRGTFDRFKVPDLVGEPFIALG